MFDRDFRSEPSRTQGRNINEISLMHPSCKTFLLLDRYSLFFAAFSLNVELRFCRFFSSLDVAEELSKIPKIIHPMQSPSDEQKISLILDPLRKQGFVFTHNLFRQHSPESSTDDRRRSLLMQRSPTPRTPHDFFNNFLFSLVPCSSSVRQVSK